MERTARPLLIGLTTWLLSGCAPSGGAHFAASSEYTLEDASHAERGETVELHLGDGTEVTGVVAGSDAVDVLISSRGGDQSIPIGRIEAMRVYKRKEAKAAKTTLFGLYAVAGIASGALCGLVIYGTVKVVEAFQSFHLSF